MLRRDGRWVFHSLMILLVFAGVLVSFFLLRLIETTNNIRATKGIPSRVMACYRGGNVTKPIAARHSKYFTEGEASDTAGRALGKRVDVLQVVATVDSVVEANVRQVTQLSSSSPFVHVIVTPDTLGCFVLRNTFSHVRCFHDNDVFNGTISVRDVESTLHGIGSEARKKGGAWYFQQMLKLGAVASGIGGLGEYVRVMDGEVVQIRAMQWFTEAGEEIFETCPSETRIRDGKIDYEEEPYNDFNDVCYGALWANLTGMPLVHDHSLIAHLMSMRQSKVRSLLSTLSPVGDTWESKKWVLNSLAHICDAVAVLGFSEYWYYASYTLLRDGNHEHLPQIRAESLCVRPGRDGAMSTMTATKLVGYLTKAFPSKGYVVLENHKSLKEKRNKNAKQNHNKVRRSKRISR